MSLNNYFNSFVKFLSPKLSGEENISDAKIIQDIVIKHAESQQVVDMLNGENYYYSDNEILKRTMTYKVNNQEYDDPNRSNYKVSHNFHKPIVDQKTQYLLKNVKIDSKDNYTKSVLASYFDNKFGKKLLEYGKEASNKGIAWWYPFVDEFGEFKFMKFPSETIIPIWDTKTQTSLVQFIRYYDVDFVDKKGKEMKRFKVEVYDHEKITYYQQDSDNTFYFDSSISTNPSYYNTVEKVTGVEYQSWNDVPLIPLFNNEKQRSDLSIYKSLIDAYDLIESDSVNNLADIQDVIWVLENYGGESLSEFMVNLKVKKSISVEEGGDARPVTFEIPYLARENVLNRLKKNTWSMAQGVDTTSNDMISVNSGKALEILYNSLDMKCNEFELQVREALDRLLDFINKYLKMNNKKPIDKSKVDMTFKRQKISNSKEKQEGLSKISGNISKRTFLQQLDFIDDPDAELEQMKKEQEEFKEMNEPPQLKEDMEEITQQGTINPLNRSDSKEKLKEMKKIV
jgi:SPP1 family phage portal protein